MAGDRLVPNVPKQWQNTKRLGHGRYRHANRADCDIACVVHQRTARLVTLELLLKLGYPPYSYARPSDGLFFTLQASS